MPTNTTNNTNTTPLSAMTGEEVASILVNLIRQNDGILIQQKVTDGINQSLGPLANDVTDGRSALVTKMRAVGIDIPSNATYQQIYDKFNELLVLSLSGCAVGSGVTIPALLGDFTLNPQNYLSEITISSSSLPANRYNTNGVIKKVTFTNVTSFNEYSQGQAPFTYMNSLIEVIAPNLLSINMNGVNGTTILQSCSNVRRFYFPKLTTATIDTSDYGVYTNSAFDYLRHFTVKSMQLNVPHTNNYDAVLRCASLYDFVLTEIKTTNYTNTQYGGSTALSTTSQSICDHDEWDDENEPVAGFQNNREKFLWYFEYHFIPCFATVTTSPTLSIRATLYNSISAAYSIDQPTKTLKQLLTDKGWEVASVS